MIKTILDKLSNYEHIQPDIFVNKTYPSTKNNQNNQNNQKNNPFAKKNWFELGIAYFLFLLILGGLFSLIYQNYNPKDHKFELTIFQIVGAAHIVYNGQPDYSSISDKTLIHSNFINSKISNEEKMILFENQPLNVSASSDDKGQIVISTMSLSYKACLNFITDTSVAITSVSIGDQIFEKLPLTPAQAVNACKQSPNNMLKISTY